MASHVKLRTTHLLVALLCFAAATAEPSEGTSSASSSPAQTQDFPSDRAYHVKSPESAMTYAVCVVAGDR